MYVRLLVPSHQSYQQTTRVRVSRLPRALLSVSLVRLSLLFCPAAVTQSVSLTRTAAGRCRPFCACVCACVCVCVCVCCLLVLVRYFGELRSLLEGAGHTVVVPVLPRSYKVERRAKALQVALGLTAVSAETVAETDTAEGGRQTQKQTPVAHSDRRDVQQAKHDERALPAASAESSEEESVTVLTNHSIDLASYKGPFHLIAHSMGGLDSRFLISHLQPEGDNRILSLTTIGSPHHGSPIADLIVEQVQKDRMLPIPAPTLAAAGPTTKNGDQERPAASHSVELPSFKIEQIVAFISHTFSLDFRGGANQQHTLAPHRQRHQHRYCSLIGACAAAVCLCVRVVAGMLDLSTSACADFNLHTVNRPDTHYRSYSGYRPFDAWSVWYLPGKLIEAREGYNDGLVSVKSAQWGQHVGTVALDHLQQVSNALCSCTCWHGAMSSALIHYVCSAGVRWGWA